MCIKMKVSYIEAKDKEKLLELLSKGFKILKVSKSYENEKQNMKRVYIDLGE